MVRGNSSDEELTLGERVEILKSERDEKASHAFASAHEQGARMIPEHVAKRGGKGRPREISSRKPVPVGRERCLGIEEGAGRTRSVRGGFDPRFEEHCGELREEHFERNYEFVQGIREKSRELLQKASGKDADAAEKLKKMEQEDLRRRIVLRRREVLKKAREEEKEAVRQGKKPFFMKESQLRKMQIEAKFKELKGSGGVKKYIEKRRKRLASKDRKLLPERRQR